MKIGELARRTGLAASKIRFYEDIGLLKLVQRKANGYRSYPPEAKLALNLIVKGQQAGFSLDELQKLVPANLDDWRHDALLSALKGKIADIDALQQKLAHSKQQLLSVLVDIEAKPGDMACADNARRVIAQMSAEKK